MVTEKTATETPVPTCSNKGSNKGSRAARYVGVLLGLAIIALVWRIGSTSESRHRLPGTAFPLNSALQAPVTENKCVACHEDQVNRFATAPHHNTLFAGDHPLVSERLSGKTFVDSVTGDKFQYTKRDNDLWLESTRRSKPLRVDWLFGSGHHASTPVTVIEKPEGGSSVLQHVMSWYPDDSINWTLGQTADRQNLPGIEAVAQSHTAQESRSCFMCHTTWLPETQDRLNLALAIPNVTCTRCHTQAEQHVGHPDHGSIQRWADLSPLESVNRCGECHRRADHMTSDELVTSNKLLVRFASASLVQSECFKAQTSDRRLDCMTCHDPHEPASTNPIFYNRKCVTCHSDASSAHCSSLDTGDQCLSCHMQKEQVQDGLMFTDHWIRIR